MDQFKVICLLFDVYHQYKLYRLIQTYGIYNWASGFEMWPFETTSLPWPRDLLLIIN